MKPQPLVVGQNRDDQDYRAAASLQAIEADDQVAIGHSEFGFARMCTGDFDGACESFAEALRLNPSAPYAIHGEADCLLFEGRMDESVGRLRELLTISPFNAMHSMPLPSHLYMARRFDEAITAATNMQVRIPRYSIHWLLAKVHWELGHFDKALEEERLELEGRGDSILLAALEEGVEYGSYEVTYIAFWPHLDALRDDSRYENLLRRVYGERAQEIRRRGNSGPGRDR